MLQQNKRRDARYHEVFDIPPAGSSESSDEGVNSLEQRSDPLPVSYRHRSFYRRRKGDTKPDVILFIDQSTQTEPSKIEICSKQKYSKTTQTYSSMETIQQYQKVINFKQIMDLLPSEICEEDPQSSLLQTLTKSKVDQFPKVEQIETSEQSYYTGEDKILKGRSIVQNFIQIIKIGVLQNSVRMIKTGVLQNSVRMIMKGLRHVLQKMLGSIFISLLAISFIMIGIFSQGIALIDYYSYNINLEGFVVSLFTWLFLLYNKVVGSISMGRQSSTSQSKKKKSSKKRNKKNKKNYRQQFQRHLEGLQLDNIVLQVRDKKAQQQHDEGIRPVEHNHSVIDLAVYDTAFYMTSFSAALCIFIFVLLLCQNNFP